MRLRTERSKPHTEKDLPSRLKSNERLFKGLESSSKRQAIAYGDPVKSLSSGMLDRGKVQKLDDAPDGLVALITDLKPRDVKEDVFEDMSKGLTQHLHYIAERYRQELSALAIFINRQVEVFAETLPKVAAIYAGILDNITDSGTSNVSPWMLETLLPSLHICQCIDCQMRVKKVEEEDSNMEVDKGDLVDQFRAMELFDPRMISHSQRTVSLIEEHLDLLAKPELRAQHELKLCNAMNQLLLDDQSNQAPLETFGNAIFHPHRKGCGTRAGNERSIL